MGTADELTGCGFVLDYFAPGIGVALQALQIGAHVGGVLVAQVAIFFERLVDDVFELARQIGIQTHRSELARGSEWLRR